MDLVDFYWGYLEDTGDWRRNLLGAVWEGLGLEFRFCFFGEMSRGGSLCLSVL